MRAAGATGLAHLTRTIEDVHAVAVQAGRHGDGALRVAHGDGMTVLTLSRE